LGAGFYRHIFIAGIAKRKLSAFKDAIFRITNVLFVEMLHVLDNSFLQHCRSQLQSQNLSQLSCRSCEATNRNCISNIRIEGLSYEEAVKKTMYLLKESRKLELSGVNLKDRTTNDVIENNVNEENFLIK